MTTEQLRGEAAAAFNEHERRGDGSHVVGNLTSGLKTLSDLLFTRIQADVQLAFGSDSMLIPLSPIKSESDARGEITLYQIAESTACLRENAYLADEHWYCRWLSQLLLSAPAENPDAEARIEHYLQSSADQRRRAFARRLERAYREATRAPLILYKLLPQAVRIVTAITFDDAQSAQRARDQQVAILPVIRDCRECHGDVLEPGEPCSACGNPLWNYQWLTAD